MGEITTLQAPGAPGIEPTWTSSDKDLVGCALGPSRLWFTIGHGIVNEVYHPRLDIPQSRDLGFIVADGRGFWVEIKRLDACTVRLAIALAERNVLDHIEGGNMVCRVLGFIARNGPASDQDRWEEGADVNTFTWRQSDGACRGQDFTVAVSNPATHTTPDCIQREIDNTQSSAPTGMDTNV